jgi:hypothetical protein
MSFKDRTIRVLFVGSILLIAQAVPALAEKVTLVCSLGPGYVTAYFTFDLAAKTVKHNSTGTFAIRVTDDEISWNSHGYKGEWSDRWLASIYNRQTTQLTIYEPNGPDTMTCQRAPSGPL